MLRDGVAIGTVSVTRPEPGMFSDHQVRLLESFADQAVIAIENVRQFNETKEALERQTATAEILKVIASSPSDVQPVLEAVAASAARLCDASDALIQLRDGDSFVNSAHYGKIAANPLGTRIPITRETVSGRAILDARQIHIYDLQAETEEFPEGSATARKLGYRTSLTTPLMHKEIAIGTILVRRIEAELFSDKHIALVKTFADQAVIAIENVRLFNESRELSNQLTDMNANLERRVVDAVAELERLGRMKRFLSPQVADLILAGGGEDPLKSHRREITVVFLDLRGFTAFTETSDPEEVMGVLREYHAEMGRLIMAHQGTLERFAGDGIMIFFNDPVPLKNPAASAVRMALEMQQRFGELAGTWKKRGYDLGMGIGIAEGYATLGAIGFEERWDYGAIGNVTNVAARLCSEALAGQILVSQRVMSKVEALVESEVVGELVLKGLGRPVKTFNVSCLRA